MFKRGKIGFDISLNYWIPGHGHLKAIYHFEWHKIMRAKKTTWVLIVQTTSNAINFPTIWNQHGQPSKEGEKVQSKLASKLG